ncbi:N-acetylneuraminate synthase [Roseospirillum parvum]|uniref:N-acetylneuraminate synthase n=1 Tax=Roseospirillum parvum TaxID=83401 RepID=A0A1G7V091_9PROT|nr:N-acetylneuraminate synthase [Roseospirillum parvum]SDG53144.1 N-acetylneuraminate synthase [Roseospirillum parvum]
MSPTPAPCLIIAEAGVNHNGSLERALEMVAVAAHAGADAIKFQTFRAEQLATAGARRAAYQARELGDGDQLSMLRGLELADADFARLAARCRELGIAFLSTAFEPEGLDMLLGLGMARVKIPSGEITNPRLLLAAARSGRPIILSTGMATEADVAAALGVLACGLLGWTRRGDAAFANALADPAGRRAVAHRVTLLQCTSAYPAPPDSINLKAMHTLAERFGLAVGLSDHSQGIAVPTAAAALGARVIEKHFTLDRTLPGPDHAASLEPDELAAMVGAIRTVEAALGDGHKAPTEVEHDTARVARRSIVAARPIAAGEPFTEEALAFRRPGTGLSPMACWTLLGRPAGRPYAAGEMIDAP